MEDDREFSSLKHKIKSTICFSCCFSRREVLVSSPKQRLFRSSSAWQKSSTRDLPDIKEKCRNLISRIGRHRKNNSADFRYDPLSYALNFDEGFDDAGDVEFPLRNFSARLPASPPPASVVQRPIVACS